MAKFKPLKLTDNFKQLSLRKLGIILGGTLGLFILANLIVLVAFSGKTYPNTKLNSISVGSLDNKKLASLISSTKFFPNSLTLKIGNKTYIASPSTLGISENKTDIVASLDRHYWLPVANFFIHHSAIISVNVNKKTLALLMSHIANLDNVAPVGAKISLVSNKFSLVSANNGYNLNQTAAASRIVSNIINNKTSVVLPLTPTAPGVTEASLKTELKSLNTAATTPLSLTYNGRSTAISTSIITGWYTSSGDSYILSSAKLEAYIKSAGQADGISVNNLNSAVSSIESALTKGSSLSFALQAVPNTHCSSNSLSELILVSISARHLWACAGPNQEYDSAVVTGDEQHADTLTPPGTYHVYAKETNKTLTGSDENGSWSDFVNYWMPFLYNQYGAYGFHDATWRPANAFGNIDPNSSDASNGCVELPLATAQWLYNWDYVGTTVEIEN